ncbi:hypothetical protein BDW22DRAFT_1334536 [Trametopsis cervina]|nr:hypothetical protein BDW22DRAFT_1334536 [Trametopsis cervina]
MSYSRDPTDEEVQAVALLAVRAFKSQGLSTCLFGGAACRLYGNSRTPNDADIVVLTSAYTTEDLKLFLTRVEPSTFYLVASRQIGATYKVLWARLKGNLVHSRRSCKVDILIPGVLNIPHIPTANIITINELPLMPLIPLLLLKLQGWSDHRESSRSDMQAKQYVDVRDITQLLRICVTRGARLEDVVGWLPREFVDAGRERLARYLETLRPAQAHLWRDVGFEVTIPESNWM